MWFAMISSIICFSLAIILSSPELRCNKSYQALSFYFLFKGTWTLFNFIFNKMWPENHFMDIVEYIGTSVFGGYLFYLMQKCYREKKLQQKESQS